MDEPNTRTACVHVVREGSEGVCIATACMSLVREGQCKTEMKSQCVW